MECNISRLESNGHKIHRYYNSRTLDIKNSFRILIKLLLKDYRKYCLQRKYFTKTTLQYNIRNFKLPS